jgi:phospholipase A1
MRFLRLKISLFLVLSSSFIANAQIQALFNNKTQLRNMTERWELDTTAVRGTFLVNPYKPMYVLPAQCTSSSN